MQELLGDLGPYLLTKEGFHTVFFRRIAPHQQSLLPFGEGAPDRFGLILMRQPRNFRGQPLHFAILDIERHFYLYTRNLPFFHPGRGLRREASGRRRLPRCRRVPEDDARAQSLWRRPGQPEDCRSAGAVVQASSGFRTVSPRKRLKSRSVDQSSCTSCSRQIAAIRASCTAPPVM